MTGATGRRSGVLQVRRTHERSWTKKVRAAFLLHLAATCNVRAACAAAGRSRTGLYQLRARDPGFAREWDLALEQGYQHLEAELLRHAMGDAVGETLEGVDEAVTTADDNDGAAAPFDADLALKLLAQWRGRDPQGRRKATHLKQPSAEEVLAALDRKLTAMEKRLGRGS